MEKVNEEIVGGLISALNRKETLEKAMMSFYNAGYEKEEIEVSARKVYDKLGPQAMGIKGDLKETLDGIYSKLVTSNNNKTEEGKTKGEVKDEDITLEPIPDKKEFEQKNTDKRNANVQQNFSGYGGPNDLYERQYKDAKEITGKIEDAIKGLKNINIPSRIEIIRKDENTTPQTVVQHVSHYSEYPQRPASKALTYVLIFILILLLGALAAVFLFKEDLIKVFNTLGFN